MGVEVQVKETGASGVEAAIRDLDQDVTFGVHDDAEDYADGTSVIVVAATQEFGSDTVPARSYLRGWVDSGGQAEIGNVAADQVSKVVDGAAPTTVGEKIGEAAVKGVLARMSIGIPGDPEGERRELDRTGHLRDSIAWKPAGAS